MDGIGIIFEDGDTQSDMERALENDREDGCKVVSVTFDGVCVDDLGFLAEYTSFHSISFDHVDFFSANTLRYDSSVKALFFYDTTLSSLEFLCHNDPIEILYLEKTKVSDLTYLKGTVTKSLKICCGEVTKFPPVQDSRTLKHLVLCDVGLKKIDVIDIPNLRVLDLSVNGLKTIEGVGCPALRSLVLGHNYLTHLVFLRTLSHLEHLHAKHNLFEDLDFLEWCPNITEIDVSYNNIKNINGIRFVKDIRDVNLSGNFYEDITPLCACNPETVTIKCVCVKDFSPLLAMTSITTLFTTHMSCDLVAQYTNYNKENFRNRNSTLCNLVHSQI